MSNTKEVVVVELTGFWLNDGKPADWDEKHNFAWKPSLSFYYKLVTQAFAQVGDEVKARISGEENLWLWQALGGRQAKGHFFQCLIETGDHPKPWTSVMPTAEVFKDGQMKMIAKPEGIKTAAPSEGAKPLTRDNMAKAPGTAPAPGPVAPATKPTAADPDYKGKAKAFMLNVGTMNSDSWWTMKRAFDYDCTDAVNCLDMANRIALMEVSKSEYVEEADGREVLSKMRTDVGDGIRYWMGELRPILRRAKMENLKERFIHMIGLCVDNDALQMIVNKAYMDLPRSLYEEVRAEGLARSGDIKAGTAVVYGTMQPEVEVVQIEKEAPVEEEIPF